MAMPASYMASEKWVISHPNYPDAVAETVTIAPPTGEQPREITAPLFANLNTTPVEDCPYFHYQQRLAQWAQQHFSEEAQRPFQDALLTLCHDPERIEKFSPHRNPDSANGSELYTHQWMPGTTPAFTAIASIT